MKLGKIFNFSKRGIINIVIAVLVFGVGGYYLGKQLFPEAFNVRLSVITPSITTEVVADTLQSKFTPEDISLATDDVAPFWPVDDSKFYVNYTGKDASELSVLFDDSELLTDEELAEQRTDIINTISDSLKSQDFKLQADEGYGNSSDVYISNDTICVVDSAKSGIISPPVRLQCGSEYEYNQDLASYNSSLDFASTYTAAGNEINTGDVFLVESDSPSTTIGFRKARVTYASLNDIGSFTMLFYREKDNAWKYFTGVQSPLLCTEYNTEEIKYAFKGDACFDQAGNESTVN